MKSFKRFIKEDTKITGKIKPWQQIIYVAMVDYLKDHFNISGDVTLRTLKKINKGKMGYVDINKLSKGLYNVTIERRIPSYDFYIMIHEFTHLQQYITHKLGSDGDMITWKGIPHTLVTDYNAMKANSDYNTYKNLPWEKEAIDNSKDKSIYKKFKTSDYYKNMYGKDKLLDYMMDEDLL